MTHLRLVSFSHSEGCVVKMREQKSRPHHRLGQSSSPWRRGARTNLRQIPGTPLTLHLTRGKDPWPLQSLVLGAGVSAVVHAA